jgi:phosphoribosyl 1,2-cyclic phosphate phosphodiesterase
MRAVFLGTGTSCGVPLIGCECRVCTSPDPRNRRRRSSLYVVTEGTHLVIDTTPDFREQVLSCRVPRVDALLFTHSHADHIFGFDDIRRFNTLQGGSIPAYGSEATLADLRRVFHYVNREDYPGAYRPRVDFRPVTGPFDVGHVHVEALEVQHGPTPTFGYLLEAGGRRLGYIPDCARITEDIVARLRGVDVMILDALRQTPHVTHLTLAQCVEYLRRIGAQRSFTTHMTHDLDHAEAQRFVPDGVEIAHDGLEVRL